MHWKIKSRVIGTGLTILLALGSFTVLTLLYYTEMIPIKYLVAAGIILLVLTTLVCILTWNVYQKGRFLIGLVLWFVVSLVLVLGSTYIYRSKATLSDITGVNTEITQMGIYVKADNAAKNLQETAEGTYGILKLQDRTTTDRAVEDVKEQLGQEIEVKEYESVEELLESLMNGEIQAFILNTGFLDILRDSEDYKDLDKQIREVGMNSVESEVEQDEGEEEEKEVPLRDRNVYILDISGIDSREGLISKSRSDVNILAVINTDTKQMLLLNTPRDYYVPLSISDGKKDKLTNAGIYGIKVVMDTLGILYDIDIDYFVRMDFGGFENIINSLGGIEVESEYDFDSVGFPGYHFNKGTNLLNGDEAMVYARERYAFEIGDRQRGKNQMAVINAVLEKLKSMDVINNYSDLLSSLSGCIETNIPYSEMAAILQKQLENLSGWNVVNYSVDGHGDEQHTYSQANPQYVMIPDETTVEHAKELIAKVINGEVLVQEDQSNMYDD